MKIKALEQAIATEEKAAAVLDSRGILFEVLQVSVTVWFLLARKHLCCESGRIMVTEGFPDFYCTYPLDKKVTIETPSPKSSINNPVRGFHVQK